MSKRTNLTLDSLVMTVKGGDIGRNNDIFTLSWTVELVTVPEIAHHNIWAQRFTGKRPEQNTKQKCHKRIGPWRT
eukprot:3300413-Heterocapsa_arctica.AAC.1